MRISVDSRGYPLVVNTLGDVFTAIEQDWMIIHEFTRDIAGAQNGAIKGLDLYGREIDIRTSERIYLENARQTST